MFQVPAARSLLPHQSFGEAGHGRAGPGTGLEPSKGFAEGLSFHEELKHVAAQCC